METKELLTEMLEVLNLADDRCMSSAPPDWILTNLVNGIKTAIEKALQEKEEN
jgi:hypothetical protein